jgi:murein DD-endopeptidase MepM/ murein hydrolase activator NlpD
MTYWPLRSGRIVTSPFGQRGDEFHTGADFGFPNGSASAPVYAIDGGTVRYCGAADGYGGPDPCGWIVIESPSGCWEYGHIRRVQSIRVGATVRAGEQIAIVNPDSNTNGGTAPHLHLSYMAGVYNPNLKSDPLPRLAGALDPPGGAALMKPDFNEYPVWSGNNQSRNGTKPDLFILHTQEGNGNADSLARWMQGNVGVSYHYTVSQDPKDNGVTVCDVVDTDLAAWSVLDYNNRSINLVFAGSSVKWTRAHWLTQSRAIDVAAYLAVQDTAKYRTIPPVVVPPPYKGTPGITDHAYVTSRGIGTHSDCGQNFPWDYFTERFRFWQNPPKPEPPKPPVAPQFPRDFTDRQLLEDIWQKLMKLVSK